MIEVEIEQIQECIPKHGYEFVKLLGYGSSSSVSLCKGIQNQQQFAIKRANKEMTSAEYSALVSLNHPNIISLYNAFEDEDSQYLVMEYCSNGTIKEKGRLHSDQFVHYAKQLIDALAYCHSNQIAHREIKPENIFIDQYDNIKLGDFGTAKKLEKVKKLNDKSQSMMFSAPEILQHKKFDPYKADIWALGITFFIMAVGTQPFKKTSVEELRKSIIYGELDFANHKINPQIRFLINKMTTKNPAARPTAEKLLKLPIFTSGEFVKKTPFLQGCRRNSYSIGLNNSTNFFLNKSAMTFENSNDDDSDDKDESPATDDKNPIPLVDVHCYRSIAVHPNIRRICLHHPATKP